MSGRTALDDGLVVGHDAAGGFYAVGQQDGEVRYLVPGSYEWMETEMGHAAWVHWTLMGDVEGFYADMREPGWEAESAALTPDQGLSTSGPAPMSAAVGRAAQTGSGRWRTADAPPRCRSRCSSSARAIMHFVKPGAYEATVPDPLPGHREIVYVSGVAEIAGALALLDRRSRAVGGLVADRAAARSLPRQREHGGQRGALPGGPGSAPVGPAADSGAAHRLGVARVLTTAVPISRPSLKASVGTRR